MQTTPKLAEILRLSEALCAIPSTQDNKSAMQAVLNLISTELSSYTQEWFDNKGVISLLIHNEQTRPTQFRLLMNGHVDVVPAKDYQFKPYVQNGRLFARGAQDMKASVAVMIAVFKNLANMLPYPIALQIATDEETGGFKSTAYQVEQGVKTQFAIIGESTNLNFCTEQKGVYLLHLTFKGQPAHTAYSWQGKNAILMAAEFLRLLDQHYPVPTNEVWRTTAVPSGIATTNTAHNKVPADASVLVDFRFIPTDKVEDIHGEMELIVPQDTKIELIAHGLAPYTDVNNPDLQLFKQIAQAREGKEIDFIRKHGCGDMRLHTGYGAGATEFGPEGEGLHTDLESVVTNSLLTQAIVLQDFALTLK